MSIDTRLAAARGRLAELGLDVLLVTQPENRRYLSGFRARDASINSSAGWLLVGSGQPRLVTSFLWLEAARAQAADAEVVRASVRALDTVAELLGQRPRGRVGIESDWLTVEQHTELAARLQGKQDLVSTAGVVADLRQVKGQDELAAITRAVEVTDAAFGEVMSRIRPGMTERQVAWDLEKAMRERGAEGMAFEPAVASGPNSAVPHHSSSDRPLGESEPIWIDMGARVDGYCGDLTRTFCLGRADARFQEVFDLVLRAQSAGIQGIRPGLSGKEADALARDLIAAAGHGDDFGHSLGHGIGLAVHEGPRLSRLSADLLRPGMVTSVEPGVYITGWGGVRTEDLGVVTPEGFVVLSRAGKQFVY